MFLSVGCRASWRLRRGGGDVWTGAPLCLGYCQLSTILNVARLRLVGRVEVWLGKKPVAYENQSRARKTASWAERQRRWAGFLASKANGVAETDTRPVPRAHTSCLACEEGPRQASASRVVSHQRRTGYYSCIGARAIAGLTAQHTAVMGVNSNVCTPARSMHASPPSEPSDGQALAPDAASASSGAERGPSSHHRRARCGQLDLRRAAYGLPVADATLRLSPTGYSSLSLLVPEPRRLLYGQRSPKA